MTVLSGKDVCRILAKHGLKMSVNAEATLSCKRKLPTQQSQFLSLTIKKLKEELFNLSSDIQEFQNKSLNKKKSFRFF